LLRPAVLLLRPAVLALPCVLALPSCLAIFVITLPMLLNAVYFGGIKKG
jgi:hypothetical protein